VKRRRSTRLTGRVHRYGYTAEVGVGEHWHGFGGLRKHDLVIVDAPDFTAPPVATVHLRRRVPFGFHGCWVRDASLG